jgi:uncharacterized membrane protein YraQ (UPF0718 family)
VDNLTTILLIFGAGGFLAWSFKKDVPKTKDTLKNALVMMKEMLIEIVGIMAIIGWVLAIIPESYIRNLLGSANELVSTLWGALIGTVTIIPAFIAFPLSKSLYTSGANLTAIAAFITTLTMVGFATFPIEKKYFKKKFSIVRNITAFFMAIIIAILMGVIL